MYFEVKLKRTCIVADSNSYGVVKETYVIDAVNYTDAEAGVAAYMESRHSGEDYEIQKISKSKVSAVVEVVKDLESSPETFFKVRVSYAVNIDGHVKRRKAVALVKADTIEEASDGALKRYDPAESMGGEVERVERTSIVDVVDNSIPCERLK